MLLTLVEAYETKHCPVDLPDPVEAIRSRVEQAGLTAEGLVPAMRGKRIHSYEPDGRIESEKLKLALARLQLDQLSLGTYLVAGLLRLRRLPNV